MADEDEERTEPATLKKREDAREKGQVARSTDVSTAIMLIAGSAALMSGIGSRLGLALGRLAEEAWSGRIALPEGVGDFHALLLHEGRELAIAFAPFSLVMVGMAIVANTVQVGFRLTPKALEFQSNRFNLVKGLGQIFGAAKLYDLAKGVLKQIVIVYILWRVMWPSLGKVLHLMGAHPATSALMTADLLRQMIVLILVSLVVFALADFAWQRVRFEKRLRMTKHEIRDELKQREGDPKVKSRIRQMQREIATVKMIEAVAEADVVVTNPTHFAVALAYRPPREATPKVVAKGRNYIAKRIREAARDNGVPIAENPPLARLLFKTCEVDRSIPENLYRAVAEVLAYIYRLDPKRAAAWRTGA